MRLCLRVALLLSGLAASPALAQDEAPPPPPPGPDLRDVMQARNYAMGGAYEALGYGAEVLNGNPAALTLYKRYQFELSGAWDVPNGFGAGSLAVADSTSALAGGLSYNFTTFGGSSRRWAHVTTAAAAYALSESIHLGLVVRHHVIIGATNTNSITMNAGLVVRPVDFLTVGFSGHNLIPNYNIDITRYFVASIAAQFANQLSPAFDLRMDFNGPQPRFAWQGGIEWLIAQSFPVRAGYQYDDIMKHQYLSGGIGWFSEGSGIDLAYRHELGGAGGRMIVATVKLQM